MLPEPGPALAAAKGCKMGQLEHSRDSILHLQGCSYHDPQREDLFDLRCRICSTPAGHLSSGGPPARRSGAHRCGGGVRGAWASWQPAGPAGWHSTRPPRLLHHGRPPERRPPLSAPVSAQHLGSCCRSMTWVVDVQVGGALQQGAKHDKEPTSKPWYSAMVALMIRSCTSIDLHMAG